MNLPLVVAALRSNSEGIEPRAAQLGLSPGESWNVLVVLALRGLLSTLARARGRELTQLRDGRLFSGVPGFELDQREPRRAELALETSLPSLPDPSTPWAELPVEVFGQLYESLLAVRPSDGEHSLRKRTGSYYTPEALTRVVVERAFEPLTTTLGRAALTARPLRILDPALGAGAFLMQAGREAARLSGRRLADVVAHELFGVDVSPLAVAVAEASLWLLADDPQLSLRDAGAHLREGDALCGTAQGKALGRQGVDFEALSGGPGGFDLVLGNPPWVAFAGRATQPLAPAVRAHYRANFRAFRGYPTLHALFVELSARLSPRGVIALLVPSPISDLEGYRQGAFPQVKVMHLRSLPAPPESSTRADVPALAERATREGLSVELRAALDSAVFSAFGITASERVTIVAFVRQLSPGAGLIVPFSSDEPEPSEPVRPASTDPSP